MPAAKPGLRAECVRLRIEERLSLREIAVTTGASKGSLSTWLREYPLTEEEKASRKPCPPSPVVKERGVESALHQTIRANGLDSLQIAKVSETAVLLRLLVHGYIPFGSVFDGDRADWVVEVPQTQKFYKIQVKTMQRASGGLPAASIRHGHNRKGGSVRYQKGDFDFLIGYDLFSDTCYVWSWSEVLGHKSSITGNPDAFERWDKLRGVA